MDQQTTSPHNAPPPPPSAHAHAHAHANPNHNHNPNAQQMRGRSPSAGNQQPHIRNSHSHSPSPHPYHNQSPEPSIGLGLGLDPDSSGNQQFTTADFNSAFNTSSTGSQFMNTSQSPQQQSPFAQQGIADPNSFDPSSFTTQPQAGYSPNLLPPEFSDPVGDFSLFPPVPTTGDYNASPLFGDLSQSNINQSELGNMTSPQTHHSPTPPHLLGADPNSGHQSPSFNQQQFGPPPGHRSHSRNASLGPEAALLPHQMGDWTQPQFQGHRRAPSEYSDVSSAGASPNLTSHDTFEPSEHGHSPMQRPQEFFEGVAGFSNFSISDPQVVHGSRSPSHSPAISPRLPPQQGPDMSQPNQGMLLNTGYPNAPSISFPIQQPNEEFPALTQDMGSPGQQAMAPPSINIDFAPNSRQNSFEPSKPAMDQTSLIPPDRGKIVAYCGVGRDSANVLPQAVLGLDSER